MAADPYDSCTTNPPADPNGQFVWLKNQLAQAKINNEKVRVVRVVSCAVRAMSCAILMSCWGP
jgi:hypothetical protein